MSKPKAANGQQLPIKTCILDMRGFIQKSNTVVQFSLFSPAFSPKLDVNPDLCQSYCLHANFNWCDSVATGDEGSSSGSGSGCSDGCTTELVFVGTEAPVIGADRSDERAAAAAAGKSLSRGPSILLVVASLTLPLWAMQTEWR